MSNKYEKIISGQEPLRIKFWSLIGVILLCFFSYGYLVRGTIVNIVARQNVESELSFLNSKVINLESEYLKVKNGITLETANGLGFVAVSGQKFVTKNTEKPGLSLVTSND